MLTFVEDYYVHSYWPLVVSAQFRISGMRVLGPLLRVTYPLSEETAPIQATVRALDDLTKGSARLIFQLELLEEDA